MGISVDELENSMSHSEYMGWVDYFNTVASVQEIQMAQLLYVQNVKAGAKDVQINDFLVSKPSEESRTVSMSNMTASNINELLGVKSG